MKINDQSISPGAGDARPYVDCRLCYSKRASYFWTGKKGSHHREFYRCDQCDLVFVPSHFFVSHDDEKSRYLEHNNGVYDTDYRKFLGRLYYALKPHLRPAAKGLDYGAGPGPALANMMAEDGFDIRVYDPYFFPCEQALDESYDFITCTETAEHFREPRREFERMDTLLETPGWLGVMTGMLETWDDFPAWNYHRDRTHVCFYSRRTMSWIARRYGWCVQFPQTGVVLFHKL